MEPQGTSAENPFERLSDDLVANILERLLWKDAWRPQESGENKARERLCLELACTRFSHLDNASGSLDWKVTANLESENAFVRYLLTQRLKAAKPLKRVALELKHPKNLRAVLFFLIPQILESIEDFRLLIYCTKAPEVSWDVVFLMLQACRNLERVHITLFTLLRHQPEYIQLELPSSMKPFPRLRSLVLLGFGVSGDRFATFISCFPQLELLELHCEKGLEYGPNPNLTKLYWWGDPRGGLDKRDPQAVAVPSSLQLLVNALGSEDEALREKAAQLLRCLSYYPECKQPIARAPGCLRMLISPLESDQVDWTRAALTLCCLANLTSDEENAKVMASSPRCLAALITALDALDSDVQSSAALALYNLATIADFPQAVASIPQALPRLVELLDNESLNAREYGADALGQLASDPAVREAIAEIPDSLAKLAGLLSDEGYTLRVAAASALGSFPDASKAVLGSPDALKNLVDLLVEEVPEIVRLQLSCAYRNCAPDLRARAGALLEKLAADDDIRARAMGSRQLIEFSQTEAPPHLLLSAMRFLIRATKCDVTG